MATVNPEKTRTKLVMFRVTEDEYAELRRRSRDEKARTMSDWARARLLAPSDLGTRVARIEAAIGLTEAN